MATKHIYAVRMEMEFSREQDYVGVYDDFWKAVKGVLDHAKPELDEEGFSIKPDHVWERYDGKPPTCVTLAIFDEDEDRTGTCYTIQRMALNNEGDD